jgi:hypothetical protein
MACPAAQHGIEPEQDEPCQHGNQDDVEQLGTSHISLRGMVARGTILK